MEPKVSSYQLVDVVSHGPDIYLEHHVPTVFADPYHTHPSIEINYLRHCDMTYSFSGKEVVIPRDRLCVFWAAYPHRPAAVTGPGLITNAYVALKLFLGWSLSTDFVDQVLSGALICSKSKSECDESIVRRWSAEIRNDGDEWLKLHRQEIKARLTRLDIEGWEVISPPHTQRSHTKIGGNAILHFDKMLRFIAHNAFEKISVRDVADAAGVSSNYAIILFNKMLGKTVKAYILDLRVHHAKMQLVSSNEKIVTIAYDCGFNSLSSFYEAFGSATGMSPAAFRESHN